MIEPLIRNSPQQDWLTLVLLSCFAIACLVEFTSSRGMLRSWFRYSVKVDYLDEVESLHKKASPTLIARLIIYVVSATVVITTYKKIPETINNNLTFFLQNLVILTCFYLLKYYISKLLAYVAKLELIYVSFQNLKSYHFGILGYALLSLLIFTTFTSIENSTLILYAGTLILFVLSAILILTRSLKVFTRHPFRFILYLCGLEIGPYLLLYKYFIV